MRTGPCSGRSPWYAPMTACKPTVLLLMRKESPGYHSIEHLFETLEPFLSESYQVRIVRVPCQSGGILGCARNLAFTVRQRADVIHVTGDIHYCALAIRRRRCVLTIHDFCSLDRLAGTRKRIFSMLWYSLPLRWAPYVTVISEETGRQLGRASRRQPVRPGHPELRRRSVQPQSRDGMGWRRQAPGAAGRDGSEQEP